MLRTKRATILMLVIGLAATAPLFLTMLLSFASGCSGHEEPGTAQDPIKGAPELSKVAEVDITGAVSPDGRFLTYTDWSTGNLAVRDLKSGEERHLTNKGSWLDSDEFALFSTISPDSQQIGYAWFNRDGFYDLRIIGVDASGPRVFFRDKNLHPWPRDWFPDGKQIVATLRERDGSSQIVLISVADGSVHVLKRLDWRSPLKVSFSPDGRYIAYDLFPNDDSRHRDIFLLSLDGKRDVPLVQHPANDLLLGWAPDGKRILFASDRSGTLDAWAIRVNNGKPQSAPELVMSNIGPNMVALVFDRKGKYYFGLMEQKTDLYTARIDPRTNRLLAPAKKIGAVGIETFTDWSPDGQFLASIMHPGIALWDLYSWTLVIRSTEAGEERHLPLKMTKYHGFHLSWSPNGDSLLAQGRDPMGRMGFYRISAYTGKIIPVLQPEAGCPPDCLDWPTWAPDGKVIFKRWADDGQAIIARDLKTLQETEVFRFATPTDVAPLAVSPDGQQLAFIWRDMERGTSALKIMPITGGEPTEHMRLEQPESVSAIAWTPDGRQLLFGKASSPGDDQRVELWRIPSAGGEPEELGLLVEGLHLYSLSLHPDGQRIAFTAGKPARREVWVLENVLPPLKAGK